MLAATSLKRLKRQFTIITIFKPNLMKKLRGPDQSAMGRERLRTRAHVIGFGRGVFHKNGIDRASARTAKAAKAGSCRR
jgi:hypothetical protein